MTWLRLRSQYLFWPSMSRWDFHGFLGLWWVIATAFGDSFWGHPQPLHEDPWTLRSLPRCLVSVLEPLVLLRKVVTAWIHWVTWKLLNTIVCFATMTDIGVTGDDCFPPTAHQQVPLQDFTRIVLQGKLFLSLNDTQSCLSWCRPHVTTYLLRRCSEWVWRVCFGTSRQKEYCKL